jgi:hypothetical protein
MHRFSPSPAVVRACEYVLAVAAHKYGVRCHEVLFMSNHFHLLLTDAKGVLPHFMGYLNSLLARAVNALQGTRGTVFEYEYNLVSPADALRALEHAVYVLANPCAANLVVHSREWVGCSTGAMRYGETRVIDRPTEGLWALPTKDDTKRQEARSSGRAGRSRMRSRLPKVVEFKLHRLPGFDGVPDDELRGEVLRRLHRREEELERERRRARKKAVGMRRAAKQHWRNAPRGTEDLFGLVPSVSGTTKEERRAARARLAAFVQAYREARARYLAGDHDVPWPYGTWLMRVRFGVPCAVGP